MGSLEGLVGIVTGASAGIGRATARAFAREGAAVVIADVDRARGADAAEAVVWLCSPAASYVTGHALAVDGGHVAQ